MVQQSLFSSERVREKDRHVRFYPNFVSWSRAAADLLAERVPATEIWWQPDRGSGREESRPRPALPDEFISMARLAACHRRDDRWHLLYRCALRLVSGEPHLLELRSDREVATLCRYAKSVQRDVHKMKAFVRFREIEERPGVSRYVSWFEPEHDIVEHSAIFFRNRFANMRWSILTPVRCAHWEGEGDLWFSEGVSRAAAPSGDRFEDAWRIYYRSIFNPARLKIEAMRAEMPQKYWKNLPEAGLIGGLVRDAGRRVTAMTERVKSEDLLQCGPRPSRPADAARAAAERAAPGSLERLALEAQHCTDCPLWEGATQTVFGEGPADARLMLVGEQPGDREDLEGRPFVGPAGRLLDQALADAGIDRDGVYVTNAVKHFRHEARGKRRLHKKPSIMHARACMRWLRQELDALDPNVVVCLGATAATALLGRDVRVSRDRSQIIVADGQKHLITTHPSYLLRLPEGERAKREYRRFVDDLRLAAAER